jgi:hypothetical protein
MVSAILNRIMGRNFKGKSKEIATSLLVLVLGISLVLISIWAVYTTVSNWNASPLYQNIFFLLATLTPIVGGVWLIQT